ncbi:LysR family transcriptional regulator [Paraburkholderia bannensis]|uniref:LysR family transcriptional regulator n=1 Tax=Paraburkholderia bannensis TaxID=765414 RepID=UPI002ABDFE25|nr:LysR family transcriptional regulator [Paraburkholderia bannensis]
MQLRTLRYFQELARSSSLRQASERLRVAPSAISRQVEALEHFFQVKLLERGPKGVKLTVEGDFLSERVDIMMREFDQVRTLIADRKNMLTGTVSIYTVEGIVAGLVAPVLAQFCSEHPNIQFKIVVSSAAKTIEAIRNGEADIAVGYYLPQRPDVVVRAHCDLTHCAVVSRQHPLSQKRSVSLRDLAELPLGVPDSEFGVRQALDNAAKQQGITLNPRFIVSSMEMQKALARLGTTIVIQPDFGANVPLSEPELAAVPIEDAALQRIRVEACVNRYRPTSRAATECLRMLEDAMSQLQSSNEVDVPLDDA